MFNLQVLKSNTNITLTRLQSYVRKKWANLVKLATENIQNPGDNISKHACDQETPLPLSSFNP